MQRRGLPQLQHAITRGAHRVNLAGSLRLFLPRFAPVRSAQSHFERPPVTPSRIRILSVSRETPLRKATEKRRYDSHNNFCRISFGGRGTTKTRGRTIYHSYSRSGSGDSPGAGGKRSGGDRPDRDRKDAGVSPSHHRSAGKQHGAKRRRADPGSHTRVGHAGS